MPPEVVAVGLAEVAATGSRCPGRRSTPRRACSGEADAARRWRAAARSSTTGGCVRASGTAPAAARGSARRRRRSPARWRAPRRVRAPACRSSLPSERLAARVGGVVLLVDGRSDRAAAQQAASAAVTLGPWRRGGRRAQAAGRAEPGRAADATGCPRRRMARDAARGEHAEGERRETLGAHRAHARHDASLALQGPCRPRTPPARGSVAPSRSRGASCAELRLRRGPPRRAPGPRPLDRRPRRRRRRPPRARRRAGR